MVDVHNRWLSRGVKIKGFELLIVNIEPGKKNFLCYLCFNLQEQSSLYFDSPL